MSVPVQSIFLPNPIHGLRSGALRCTRHSFTLSLSLSLSIRVWRGWGSLTSAADILQHDEEMQNSALLLRICDMADLDDEEEDDDEDDDDPASPFSPLRCSAPRLPLPLAPISTCSICFRRTVNIRINFSREVLRSIDSDRSIDHSLPQICLSFCLSV